MAVCHIDSVECLGEGTDLVYLDEDRVTTALSDTTTEVFDIRYEEVITYELDLLAELVGELLPAFPVVLCHTIFNRVDRILLYELGEEGDLLIDCTLDPVCTFELRVVVHTVLEELRGSAVHSDRDVLTRYIACLFYSLQDRLDSVLCTVESGSEATFVTYSCAEATVVEHLLEAVEDLGTHTKTFTEGRGSDGTDHEFLEGDRSIGVRAPIDDVHHRYGEHVGIRATDVAVEGDVQVLSSSLGYSQRDTEDSICTELALGLGTIEGDHL